MKENGTSQCKNLNCFFHVYWFLKKRRNCQLLKMLWEKRKTHNFQTDCFPPEMLAGSVLLALIISVHLTASWSSMKRSLYWFLSIRTRAISTLVNLFLCAKGTSSSSSLFVAFAAVSASSLTFFSSSSRAVTFWRKRSLACCKPRTSSRRISCSLKYFNCVEGNVKKSDHSSFGLISMISSYFSKSVTKNSSSNQFFHANLVISSTLTIRSSLTIFRAFFVANNSLFSIIRFSTSFPIPASFNQSFTIINNYFWFLFFDKIQ